MVTWNLNELHNLEETENVLSEISKQIDRFAAKRSELNETITSERFLTLLKEYEALGKKSNKLSSFASLWLTENTADPKRNALVAKISDRLAEESNKLIFFMLWFKSISDEKAQELIAASGEYHYFLETVRKYRPHSLSEKEEQVINLLETTGSEALVTLYDMITNRFRFEWEGKKVAQEEVTKHYADQDPKKRENAYRTILTRYKEEQPVLGEIYKNLVRNWKNEELTLRKHKTPIAVRNLANDIPDSAIETLLNVIKENAVLFQEFFRLKAKLTSAPLSRFHIYAPLPHEEQQYSYEKSKEMCLNAYKEFSEEAYNHAKSIFDQNHVHSELTENKQSGAFCSSVLPKVTPYILLNHVGKLDDVFTMMHELGHGIHSIAAREHTSFTFHSALPLAETASIFGELILLKNMLKTANENTKRYLLAKQLDKQYASIVRQAFFVLFENTAHDMIAQGCTIDELNEAYRENLKVQFGDLDIDELFQNEWNYIPHIHHTPFYCYAYAFGNLLVLALWKRYEEEGKTFVPKYMKLLSKGGSAAPQDILNELNIDLCDKAFWQGGFDIIKKELEELHSLLN